MIVEHGGFTLSEIWTEVGIALYIVLCPMIVHIRNFAMESYALGGAVLGTAREGLIVVEFHFRGVNDELI